VIPTAAFVLRFAHPAAAINARRVAGRVLRMTSMKTWLICGGRNFSDKDLFISVMNNLVHHRGYPDRIIEGGALGADRMGQLWAFEFEIQLITVRADWRTFGRAAGPRRNQIMINEYKPELVIAFPGGAGTSDMVRRSLNAGIPVRKYQNDHN